MKSWTGIALLFLTTTVCGQVRVATITNETTPSSKAVMTALRSKIAAHPKQFTLVGRKDPEVSLLVTLDCIPQKVKTDPFDCFYTASYAGGTTKTFMGGGIYESATADEASDNFLSSIAPDCGTLVRDGAGQRG
jgi:hypothetical protein